MLPYSVATGLETMAHILDYGSLETMLTDLYNGEFFHSIGATGLYKGYHMQITWGNTDMDTDSTMEHYGVQEQQFTTRTNCKSCFVLCVPTYG